MQSSNKNILFVHGIFDTGRIFRYLNKNLKKRLEKPTKTNSKQSGLNIYNINLKPCTGHKGIEHLAEQLDSFVREKRLAESNLTLIGFSMGGIVSRYYLQRLGGIAHVDRFIAIASPHFGTYTGYTFPVKSARQMRPNSAFLNDLNQDIHELESLSPVSIWTPYDLMIIPAKNCIMPIGEHIKIHSPTHKQLIYNTKVLEYIESIYT